MPHCILEYSSNIIDEPDVSDVLLGLNGVMIATGLFSLNDIKSRAIEYDKFVVGDGAPERAFVALTIRILSGRTAEVKTDITKRALDFLETKYPLTWERMKCSITVEILELDRETYRRMRANQD